MWVAVGRVLSSQRRVTSGVPQSSVLDHTFCCLYVFLTLGLASNYGPFAENDKVYLHYQREAELDGIATLHDYLNRLTAVAVSWNLFLKYIYFKVFSAFCRVE